MVTLVARDSEGAERVAAVLRAAGNVAIACPVLTWVTVDERPDLPEVADILVTSPRAADALGTPLPGWRVLALAGATADRLRAHGVEPAVVAEGGAAALAALAGPGPLVHLTSDLGGEESAGVRPDRLVWVGYHTQRPPALPIEVTDAIAAGDFAVWFGSPSAVRNFEELAPGAARRASVLWTHGGTTFEAVRQAHPTARPIPRAFPR